MKHAFRPRVRASRRQAIPRAGRMRSVLSSPSRGCVLPRVFARREAGARTNKAICSRRRAARRDARRAECVLSPREGLRADEARARLKSLLLTPPCLLKRAG